MQDFLVLVVIVGVLLIALMGRVIHYAYEAFSLNRTRERT